MRVPTKGVDREVGSKGLLEGRLRPLDWENEATPAKEGKN
jgi:hypothetical protein